MCNHSSIKCDDPSEDKSKVCLPRLTDLGKQLKIVLTMSALKQWLTTPWKGRHWETNQPIYAVFSLSYANACVLTAVKLSLDDEKIRVIHWKKTRL